MALQEKVMDLSVKGMNLGHRFIRGITGGRVLSSVSGMPVVELRTIGRKSGQQRSCLLTAPIHDENRVLGAIASKGGDDRHPDWYRRARTASAAEKKELWPQVVAAYKSYASYQRRTDRDIPVVILEPRS
ncbi:nitroreductase/quinone reductase family protein [Antrihabitans sp. NCIMB 15449]|uniref:Nitroreductase/quinone reductase family protein n=1 Tax=Antrihabitans spumae TaxID=3373370 RepID=A0ABW7JRU9_9NOCA